MPNLSPIFYRLGVVFPGGVGYNKTNLTALGLPAGAEKRRNRRRNAREVEPP